MEWAYPERGGQVRAFTIIITNKASVKSKCQVIIVIVIVILILVITGTESQRVTC